MNKIVLEDSLNEINLGNESKYIIIPKDNASAKFNILDNSNTNIVQINKDSINIKYDFKVLNNSNVCIDIFDYARSINSKINIYIDGENSNVTLNISSISEYENEYEINVYHNSKNTISNTVVHGVTNKNGKILVTNNGYIKKGCIKSKLSQDNKIITMDENNSKIQPNLYIDEYDIEASHGAYIGKFDFDTIFYLESRGLSEKESYNLLIKGFLLENFYKYESLSEDLIDIINKYWR